MLYHFVETTAFTRSARAVLTDAELKTVQQELLADPRAGDVVAGTGGARKIRVALPGRGKSGGARVIYYYVERTATIYLLLVYPKNVASTLTQDGKAALHKLLRQLNEEG